jgi:adenine-specific DNA-methyltransferase
MSLNKATLLKPVAISEALFTNAPEEAYTASVPESHRKNFGQFFTPVSVAEFMAKWIMANPLCRTILDPATGLGVFFRTINKINVKNSYKFVGYDIDPTILGEAKSLLPDSSCTDIELKLKDYLFNDWHNKYDGIICNPPYFKFQDYKNRAISLREFQTRLGMNLSGFTNIYTMFLLKAVSQLTFKGRAAFLVPFEFLNADYGTTIKKHLLESKTLRYVILFNSKENVFNNALTTSCILLMANDDESETITFIDAHNADNLKNIFEQIASYPHEIPVGTKIRYSDIDPDLKWRVYYQKQNGGKFKNLVTLSAYGKVVRGIATGDNDYFTFDVKKQKEFSINDKFLLPCLTKAVHANTNFFTRNDFDKLRLKGSRVFLFNASDLTDKAVKQYVELGEKLEVNERYLTKHRTPWHIIENRPPAPILVTVFNRAGLRFVRNEAGVRNLTCFHAIYLNLFGSVKVDLLMAYFLSDVSKEILNDNRREYGGGLNKFEPNDLNKAKVVDLDIIDANTEHLIQNTYETYRESVLCSEPNVDALKMLNDTFLSILK